MLESNTIKGGSFKTMNLQKQLFYNIPFENPTPIQRKTIPLILENRSIMGIARTGSGKTLAYLLPAVQKAYEGKSTLILLPTKELVLQVKRIYKNLSFKVEQSGNVEITTFREISTEGYVTLVIDEIDRVLEEKSLRTHFTKIDEEFNGQRIYFSATLPKESIDIKIVKIESKIPENIKHNFYYVPSECKESALLSLINCEKKTIIFAATKYGVEFVLGVFLKHNFEAKGIYAGMDDDARKDNFDAFLHGEVRILVVTDVASRGIDIPQLDVAILYDVCDEKTFVHRVGRIRGMGEQYTLVTYSDVFHFFNIKETHLPGVEIGTMPQELLDRYDLTGLESLKYMAARGMQRCLEFRGKVSVPSNFKAMVDSFDLHSNFKSQRTLANELRQLRKMRKFEEPTVIKNTKKFTDEFYIPYTRKERQTHTSSFAVGKDDYVIQRKPKERRNYKKINLRGQQTK